MIKKTIIINDLNDLKAKLAEEKLRYKGWLWDNYTFLPKKDYYRLVIFDNNEYGLFTQSQYYIVKAHQELNSVNWRDYKPYADPDYKVMKENGVKAGSLKDSSWTTIKKTEFRKSSEWKLFTHNIIYYNTNYNNKCRCEDCSEYFNPNEIEIHHLDPDNYDNLDRRKFKLLCHNCHKLYTERGL